MILEAKNVEYAYKSQKERKVLDNISVRFEEKKFYTCLLYTSNPAPGYAILDIRKGKSHRSGSTHIL